MTAESSPAAPDLYRASWARCVVYCISGIVVISAVVTAVMAVRAFGAGDQNTLFALAAAWTVVPPVWFWIDYFIVFRRGGDQAQFDEFKHGQQVSAAIWAAVALSLFALATSDAVKDRASQTPAGGGATGAVRQP